MALPAAGLCAHTPAGLMHIGRYPLLSLTRVDGEWRLVNGEWLICLVNWIPFRLSVKVIWAMEEQSVLNAKSLRY
jgi:hypothetical protein